MKKIGAATAALTLGLTAACGGGSSDVRTGDGLLKFGAVLAHSTLDPDLLPVAQMSPYLTPLYDTLTLLSPDESVEPLLATEWESGEDGDGPYLDMTLRDGLSFPDGTPFTSETVIANIDRSQELEGSTNAVDFTGVTVEATDTHRVRFRSEQGVGALPRILAGPAGMMISDEAIETGTDLTEQSAGIGSFTLDTVQPNRVVYKANDGYRDEGAAAAETLEIHYLADDAKLNAIRSGDLDIALLPQQMVQTAEDSGYEIERSLGAENYTFSFNTEMEPFDDVRVREAVSLALDQQAVCDSLLEGECEPTGQFFGAGTNAYDPDLGLERFPFDLEKAKKLVKEAGAQGAEVEIVTVAGNQVFEQLATIVQAQLTEIGLDAAVSPVAPPQVVSRFTAEKNVAMAFGATGNAFDPSVTLQRYGLVGGLYNPGGLEDPEVEELAKEALLETDQEERSRIYREISGMYAESMLVVPVLTPESSYVIAPGVEGWEAPWAPSFPSFRGVSD
ncbi:peptide/nickel transport system substrate-binding protein [Spinactinospora alkalitolerans]|uniref:Peptide/nickel transport system substrate-binding protein n=1 Tax=Spinactinospora alkalitolerans TaxID=687207 RepID=A0A852TX16_9ACTN|nr:ABC transporter substrate-binding protein [Spinactinospora alkalitolerans]NYE47847.1 peptide/nickel transport system substrate-binding protein [Spinactinospora alkalitolerans]